MRERTDYNDITFVPRVALTMPVVLPLPEGFDPVRLETWPKVEGRLEFVSGRLLYMPPCGDEQVKTVADVVTDLGHWRRLHPEFVLGTNEAGMLLGGELRAADAAVWRKSDLGKDTGGVPRVPPILAVEVAGRDETLESLTEKAYWYLAHGVEVVWILVPRNRSGRVVSVRGISDLEASSRLPEPASLPGLSPRLEDLFLQLAR